MLHVSPFMQGERDLDGRPEPSSVLHTVVLCLEHMVLLTNDSLSTCYCFMFVCACLLRVCPSTYMLTVLIAFNIVATIGRGYYETVLLICMLFKCIYLLFQLIDVMAKDRVGL